jgi:hypothetical protein
MPWDAQEAKRIVCISLESRSKQMDLDSQEEDYIKFKSEGDWEGRRVENSTMISDQVQTQLLCHCRRRQRRQRRMWVQQVRARRGSLREMG